MGRLIVNVVVSAVLVLLLAEGFTRLFLNGPSPQRFDAEIGFSYIPHATRFHAKEGYARLRLNALGLNDDELGPKQGRKRVLVVGDSYCEAIQVPRQVNFTSVTEQLNRRLDVVNAGRDGLFIGHYHAVGQRLMHTVDADLVVYAVSLSDLSDDLVRPDMGIRVDRSTGRVVGLETRVQREEKLKKLVEVARQHSALVTRLSAQLQPAVMNMVSGARTLAHGFASLGGITSAGASEATPGLPADVRISDEDLVEFLFRRLAAADAPAAVLYLSELSYEPDGSATVAARSAEAQALAARAAEAAGLPFLSNGAYLLEAYRRSGRPTHGFNNGLLPRGHLNEVGHDATARALVDLVEIAGRGRPERGS